MFFYQIVNDNSNESPNENGFYWASRFTDLLKVFSYRPMNFYANADYTNFGDEYQSGEVCRANPTHCPELLKPENIIGIQGHLWSETMRNPEMLLGQLFPRFE